jgi:hypothetical protein
LLKVTLSRSVSSPSGLGGISQDNWLLLFSSRCAREKKMKSGVVGNKYITFVPVDDRLCGYY